MHYRMTVLGPFRLAKADGTRIPVTSKKAIALFGLLATSDGCERSRAWIQEKLWGSRESKQGQSSLRRELSNLRKLTGDSVPLIETRVRTIRLIEENVSVDLHDDRADDRDAEFLEGIDIPGEEAFEDWLRETRSRLAARREERTERDDKSYWPVARQNDYRQFSFSPALAVLPIDNRVDKESVDAFLSTALAQEVTNGLARLRWIPVISQTSSMADALIGDTPENIAQRLNARYIVSGTLLPLGAGARLNLSLTAMPDSRLIWSENRDFATPATASALQDAIHLMINSLARGIDHSEQQRALEQPVENLDIVSLAWRARYHIDQFTRDDMIKARAYLDQALAIAPHSPEIIILDAYQTIWKHWVVRAPVRDVLRLRACALRAMRADLDDARGPLMAGVIETWLKNFDQAIGHLERAIELNPSFESAHAHLGAAHYLNSEPDRAISPLLRSLELSPFDHRQFYVLGELAISYFMLDQHEAALDRANQILLTRPGYVLAHVVKVNALMALGRREEAIACRDILIARKPALIEEMFGWMPFREPHWIQKLREGIDMAADGAEGPLFARRGPLLPPKATPDTLGEADYLPRRAERGETGWQRCG